MHNACWDGSVQEPPDRDTSSLGWNQHLSGDTETKGGRQDQKQRGKLRQIFLQVLR